jgi:pilus assembly protein CpaB
MRPKSLLLLVVALGCGLVASIGINQMLSTRQVEASSAGPTVSVFLAKQPINLGDVIKSDMVRMEEFPADKLPPDAITQLDELKGRRARSKILPGMPIVDGWLLAKGESGDDVTTLVPKGYRVIPVRVDAESGGAGLIKPGDRVDVLVHLRENSTSGVPKTTTITFLQNVKVFAIDDVFRREADGEQSVAAKTISLVVTPDQAELVTHATQMGTVRMIIRNSEDDSVADTSGATADQLFRPNSDAGPAAEPTAPTGNSGSGLLSMLNSQRTQAEPVQVAKDHWKMLLFDGPTPRSVDFEDGVPLNMEAPISGVPAGTLSTPEPGPAVLGP